MIGRVGSRDAQRLPVSADLEPTFAEQFPTQYRALVDNERRGDFIALIADAPLAVTFGGAIPYVRAFEEASRGLGLRTIALELSTALMIALPDTTRSDHAAFWANGYSAVMITDTAELRNPNYHCGAGADHPDTLDYDFAAQVTLATASAAAVSLGF